MSKDLSCPELHRQHSAFRTVDLQKNRFSCSGLTVDFNASLSSATEDLTYNNSSWLGDTPGHGFCDDLPSCSMTMPLARRTSEHWPCDSNRLREHLPRPLAQLKRFKTVELNETTSLRFDAVAQDDDMEEEKGVVDMVQELLKEATDNMAKDVTVLSKEPNGNVLNSIVQSRLDCWGRNIETIFAGARSA